MKKKFGAILLATCLLASFGATGTACNKGGEGEKVDTSRTQLYVNVRNCGIGREFLDNLKATYEKMNPDVQVMISTQDSLDDAGLKTLETMDKMDVVFAPNFILNDFVSLNNQTSDYFADITDIVTEGGDDSIMSRMYREEKDYHNIGTVAQPKFYSLPWYVSYHGTVYDVDLFEEKNFYDIEGYAGLDCEEGTADDFWGPDGKENTYDDGLPATWEDMKLLLDEMSGNNITPFTWTSYSGYSPAWLSSIWANYEGADNFSLLGSVNGTYKYSEDTKWLSGGTENAETGVKELAVSMSNGNLMAYQNGKKAALEVAEYIITNKLFSARATGNSQNHYEAQTEYLFSAELCKTDSKVQRIAFLLEGSWWENEAKESFAEMAEAYNKKYAYGTRRFGYFPWPKFVGSSDIPDQVNMATTLMGGVVTNRVNACAVNKKSKQLALAKDFVKFAYSRQGNAIFTTSSGVLAPFDYTLTKDEVNSLTSFQKSLYEISREETTQKVSGYTRTGAIYTASSYISGIFSFSAKDAIGNKYSEPFTAFTTSTGANKVTTAEGYMDLVKTLVDTNKTIWK